MADANSIQLRLVTPDRILVDQTVDAVEVPGKSGYFEVLYGAAPLLSELGPGIVRLHGGEGGDQQYFVSRGFVEVLPERVTILAETAMKPEDIDTGEAKEELEEGKKLWSEAGDESEKYTAANEVIREAESMLENAQGGSKQ